MMESLAALFASLLAFVPGFAASEDDRLFGYVENDVVLVAPQVTGTITEIAVTESDTVSVGTELFSIDDRAARAERNRASAALAASEATLANRLAGSRPEEIAVLEYNLNRAVADRDLARATLDRTARLTTDGYAANATLDQHQAAFDMATAQVAELTAQIAVARLPSRDNEIAAAQADVEARRAELERAEAQLADYTASAPVSGSVERIFFDRGEQTSPSRPVLSILPPDGVKIIFFIPEPQRSTIGIGDRITVGCDGCGAGIEATVTWLSGDTEFTPPVIYSLDERARLVFRAEARPEETDLLRPGQPVDILVSS